MNPSTDKSDAGAANLAFARALIDELHAAGIATVVICPGSRSTPLALAVAQQSGLPHSVHIDERKLKRYGLLVVAVDGTEAYGAPSHGAAQEAAHEARSPLPRN